VEVGRESPGRARRDVTSCSEREGSESDGRKRSGGRSTLKEAVRRGVYKADLQLTVDIRRKEETKANRIMV